MKKDLIYGILSPIVGIIVAELLIYFGYFIPGLLIYIINTLLVILVIILSDISIEIKHIRQSLLILFLLRIVNLSTPQFFTMTLQWYPLIYGAMFIPIYNLIDYQQISLKELGISTKKLYIYIPLSLLIGFFAAIGEYEILNPIAVIENIQLSNILLISIIMFAFVGMVEELIFRSILQTRLEKVLGLGFGLILSSFLFGIMHFSYGIYEVIFTFGFGLLLGFIFQKTRSLPFIVSIHGIENVLLFGIFPLINLVR